MADEPREPGPVEQGVLEDLKTLGVVPAGRGALKAMALKLARTIDNRGDDEAASALAKAVDTLRQVMNQLTARELSDPNELRGLGQALGTPDLGSPSVSPPLRYPPESRPANSRTGNRTPRKRARPD